MPKKPSQIATSQAIVLIAHQMDDGQVIEQRRLDGYFNATAMCQAAGKRFYNYASTGPTIKFLDELSSDTGIPVSELIQSVRGGDSALQGTWVHRHIAYNLAQWLSAKFAVQVSKWLDVWMGMQARGAAESPAPPPRPLSYHERLLHDRIDWTYDLAPPDYFNIFQQSITFQVSLIRQGVFIDPKFIPDISMGQHWAKYWGENDLAALYGDRIKATHFYPPDYPQAKKNPHHPWHYPDEALPEFRRWVRYRYLPNEFLTYLQSKEKQGALPATTTARALAALIARGQMTKH